MEKKADLLKTPSGLTHKLDDVYEKENAVVDPVLARLQSRLLPKEEW